MIETCSVGNYTLLVCESLELVDFTSYKTHVYGYGILVPGQRVGACMINMGRSLQAKRDEGYEALGACLHLE